MEPRKPACVSTTLQVWRAAVMFLALAMGCGRTHVVLIPGMTDDDGSVAMGAGGGGPGTGGGPPPDGGGGAGGGPAQVAAFVELGQIHACAIGNGALYCWGQGRGGSLGLGPGVGTAETATRIGADAAWRMFSGGTSSSAGLKQDGSLWAWGANEYGELGVGDQVPRYEPTRVGTRTDWVAVTAHFTHACAVAADGSLWCWGANYSGESGQGGRDPGVVPSPARVGVERDWVAVQVGGSHTCGIRGAGALYCWGDNTDGRLGVTPTGYLTAPAQVGTAADWQAIATGLSGTCGIRSGALYCWGASGIGDDGSGIPRVELQPVAVATPGLGTLVQVSIHAGGGCVRDASGVAACWGANYDGELGFGDQQPRPYPTPLLRGGWTHVSVGFSSVCGVSDAVIYCAGSISYGQPGDPLDRNDFVAVPLP